MEDIELQKMWALYDSKLQQAQLLNMQAWALNLQTKEALQMQKAKSRLNRLAKFKTWVIALGIIWVLGLSFLVFNHITWQGIFFNISVGMIAFITAVGVAMYIKQVVLIRQTDETNNIAETQQQLALLQASTIQSVRVLWLQLPFYCTFFLTPAMVAGAGFGAWCVILGSTGFFTFAAIWLYRNIRYENRHKKWFKVLFSSLEWTYIIKAMDYLDEVEEWKREF